MASGNTLLAAFAVLVAAAIGAGADIRHDERSSLIIYTTPALRDVLEKGVVPAWEKAGGRHVELVYLAAGSEYNRLRMSPTTPEPDLFLHASPLMIEKGADAGLFVPVQNVTPHLVTTDTQYLAAGVPDWVAFAWSPIVEVYGSDLSETPDLGTTDLRVGLAHPTLSNNGIYTALLFDAVSPSAGRHALGQTVVQPVNARANILGVADGSFDVTLGYDAVAQLYIHQGAQVQTATPLIDGERVAGKALFVAGVVRHGEERDAQAFVQYILSPAVQDGLGKYYFRPTATVDASDEAAMAGARVVEFNWSDWERIETILPHYEVSRA